MKKETINMVYDRPEIEVINFNAEPVICASDGENEDNTDDEL